MNPATLWRATRAYSLPASLVPVLLGTVLAANGYGGSAGGGRFQPTAFTLVLLGAILAHFGANVVNDLFDFRNGVDTRPEHGSGVLTGGQMSARGALVFGALLLAGAAGCGGLLLWRTPGLGAVVLPLVGVGLACAVGYPAFLKRFALGDLLVILAFGLGLTLGAFGVQAGGAMFARQWLRVSLFAVPVCLLVDAILHANNLRDAADDRVARVHTLATLLPPRAGQRWQLVLLFGPLVFVLGGVGTRLLPVWSLGTLACAPLLWRAARSGSVPGTAQAHLAFGLLYIASFLLPPVFL